MRDCKFGFQSLAVESVVSISWASIFRAAVIARTKYRRLISLENPPVVFKESIKFPSMTWFEHTSACCFRNRS